MPELMLPPRAPIYGPGPIAVGTVETESLSSYYLRLAAAHNVTPQRFRSVVPPFCDRTFQDALATVHAYDLRNILDGTAVSSAGGRRLGVALGHLAGRAEVEKTTFEYFRGNIDTTRLIRRSPRWCPLCLQADHEPYERMHWCMQVVGTCSKHGVRLQGSCPHCGAEGKRTLHEGKMYRCQACSKDVFRPEIEIESIRASVGSMHAAQNLEALFEMIFQGSLDLTAVNLSENLRWFCAEIGAFSLKEQAVALGITKGSLSEWYSGAHALSFTRFLELCIHVGVAPLQVLRRNPGWDLESLQLGNRHRSHYWLRAAPKVSKYDKPRLMQQLSTIHNRHPTMGIFEISKQLGMSSEHIRRLLPTASRLIDRHASQERKKIHVSYEEKLCREADRVLDALVIEGSMPTRKVVSSRMCRPGAMRNPTLRAHVTKRIEQLARGMSQAA